MDVFCVQEGWERRNDLQSKEVGRGGGAGRIPWEWTLPRLRSQHLCPMLLLRGLPQQGTSPADLDPSLDADVILVASALALAAAWRVEGCVHAGLTTLA